MDDDDALLFTVRDLGKLAHFAFIDDVSGVAAIGINAAQHVHKGRLSCAVLADQRVDRPLLHLQIHVVQGPDSGKQLGDISHFQNVFRQDTTSFHGFGQGRNFPPCPNNSFQQTGTRTEISRSGQLLYSSRNRSTAPDSYRWCSSWARTDSWGSRQCRCHRSRYR